MSFAFVVEAAKSAAARPGADMPFPLNAKLS
jgi:hypothetical protein